MMKFERHFLLLAIVGNRFVVVVVVVVAAVVVAAVVVAGATSVVVVEVPVNNTTGRSITTATRRIDKTIDKIIFDFIDIPIMINIVIETINQQSF